MVWGLRLTSYPSIAHARGQSLPNATKCRWVAPDRAWRLMWTIESAAWEGGEISVVICPSLTGRFLFDNKLLELALCKPHPLGVVGVREGKEGCIVTPCGYRIRKRRSTVVPKKVRSGMEVAWLTMMRCATARESTLGFRMTDETWKQHSWSLPA